MRKILSDPMLWVITIIIVLVIYGINTDNKNKDIERSEQFDKQIEYYHTKEKDKYKTVNVPDWSSKVKGVVIQ